MKKLEDFNLNNINEHKGKWSLDLNDIIDKKGIENAIPGTLKIDNGRVRLELNGILNDLKNVKFDESVDIYGYLNNGLLVKLEKCYLIFINCSSQGYDIENYESYRGFIIDSNNSVCLLDQSLKATQIRFSMNFIDDWYNIDLPEKDEISNGRGFSIRYKNSFFDENEHEVMDGKIFIKLARNQNVNFNINKGVSPVLDSFIKIYVKDYTPVSLNELLGYSMWTKDFINFITHISGNLTYITFLLEDNDNRYRMEELENGKINFKLPFYEGSYIFPQVTYSNSELQFSSLRLKDIFEDFGKLINNWFNNKDKLEYIISLYFQNQLTYLDVNTKLVNQIMILETYYDNFKTKEREFICDRDIKVNEAKSKLKDQIDSFDLEYNIKEELIKNIDYSSRNNYPNMREKIKVVLESLPLEVKNIFYDIEVNCTKNKDFFENFAVRLKDTRNYYIHGANSNKNQRRFKSTIEIIKVNQVLDYVIYYLVLKALEIEEEKILNYPLLRSKIAAAKLIQ